MNNTHEWCNVGINSEIENLQEVPCLMFPNWMKILHAHQNIIIPSVLDLPETWQGEREILEPQGIQSLVAIPLLFENILIGFVGLDSVKSKRVYNSSEINILKVWSSMLASLIHNKRTEALLEQTRLNYETFFNTIDDFLWVLDGQGNIIHTNNTVENRLGYTTEELRNTSVLMVHPAERREEAGRIVGEMLAGTSELCPVPIVTKSGKQIPVETRVKAGFWDGVPVIFGVSRDVSQIQLSEQKFSSAFQSNSAIMVITRFDDDQFVDVNNAFINTLGYSREEIKGKTFVNLGVMREKPEEGTIQELIKRGIPVREIEINAYSKSNELFILLLSAEAIYIGSDRCILSVAVNITDRKMMENELRKAREEADQANLAKSEFLSRMSHELRTPMNSILGFGQLLEMGELTTSQKKGVGHILKSGKHLLDLINEVLEISRIEAGKISLSLEPVQISAVVQEMLDMVKLQASERQIKIEFIDSPSNQMFVKSDRQRFKQVLLNLLNNAIKYNRESGSVLIKTEIQSANNAGIVMIKISITDTGWGISADNMPKLFSPFERIGAEKSMIEGTGLGLMVVKKL
jgi:PAS domain S-box-containing protein